MTAEDERLLHALAVKLEQLTRGSGWAAMQYLAIGRTITDLCEYCAPEGWLRIEAEVQVGKR